LIFVQAAMMFIFRSDVEKMYIHLEHRIQNHGFTTRIMLKLVGNQDKHILTSLQLGTNVYICILEYYTIGQRIVLPELP